LGWWKVIFAQIELPDSFQIPDQLEMKRKMIHHDLRWR
jgi:hypothetical protein